MDRRVLRGSLLLLLGAVIWGAAFAAQRAAMDSVSPFTFSGVRMLLAALVMTPAAALAEKKSGSACRTPEGRRDQFTGGLLCGLFLFAATSLQQAGLVWTTAGKAGFLTALYVVLVPLAGALFLKKRPGRIIRLGVALAVAALYLLCIPTDGFVPEKGDLLQLGCAVCFTGQILCVDRYAPKVNCLKLARDEFLITGALSMLAALLFETIRPEGLLAAIGPILYAGAVSGAVGYGLQILGQRDVEPTIASLIMCLEAVFAVLTGALLLGERMSGREIAGCVLMFAAVILAQLSTVTKRQSEKDA